MRTVRRLRSALGVAVVVLGWQALSAPAPAQETAPEPSGPATAAPEAADEPGLSPVRLVRRVEDALAVLEAALFGVAAAAFGWREPTGPVFAPDAAPGYADAPAPAPTPEVADPPDIPPSELAQQVEEALAAAEAALDAEAARIDELAARLTKRVLPDGTPSAGQAAANARLWNARIREAEERRRALQGELAGALETLAPDIAALAERLSPTATPLAPPTAPSPAPPIASSPEPPIAPTPGSPPTLSERSLALTRAQRASIQQGLNALGFDAGAADGVFGARTRTAIRAWQRADGRDGTGYLTRQEIDALIAASEHAGESGGST